MNIKEDVDSTLKELLLPELAALRQVMAETKTTLGLESTKRVDDLVAHLMDQSRRIDALERRLVKNQDAMNARLDKLLIDNVRRAEYELLAARVQRLELEVEELKRRVAI